MYQAPDCGRNLPDLLTCLDGTPVTSEKVWFEKRRPEILDMLKREEYGRLPDMSDVSIDIRIADSRQGKEIMEGRAIRRTIEITAVRNGIHFSFPAVVFIPTEQEKPVPVLLTICNRGIKDGDPARHFLSPFWPAETMVSRGYAAAVILTQDIAPDYDEGFSMGFHKLFPRMVLGSQPNDGLF